MRTFTILAQLSYAAGVVASPDILRNLIPRQNGDTLDQLGSLGVELLSNILEPMTASSTTSSTTSTPTSNTAARTSASTTSTASSSQLSSAASSAVSSASASARALSSSLEAAAATALPTQGTGESNNKNRNLAIILGTVLGFLVLILLIALMWLCCRRRRKARSGLSEKDTDDDDIDVANGPGGDTTYVTRIESWHEPRGSRNSSRGPPLGSQSRVSMIHRNSNERYSAVPSAPVPEPVPIPPPHRTSQYGLIQNTGPFEDPKPPFAERPGRRSLDDMSRDRRQYPGYTPYRSNQSSQSLIDRTPPPPFGNSRTPPAGGVIPPVPAMSHTHTIKRKSVGSSTDPTIVGSSTDPSPHSIGGGPFVPPPRNPNRRSREFQRENLPGSPLAHEFEFGFGDQQRRRTSGERPRMPGGWSNSSTEMPQRY